MPSKFTEDEQTRILLVLALHGGHSLRAHAQLQDEGINVSDRQLRNLVHTDRYRQIREHHAAHIERSLIEHYKDAGRRSLELQMLATEKAIEQAHNGDLKDPAKTAQNAALASGIAIDKALLLDGRPNVIHGNRDVEQLVNALNRTLGFDAITTATDITQEKALMPEGASANARD